MLIIKNDYGEWRTVNKLHGFNVITNNNTQSVEFSIMWDTCNGEYSSYRLLRMPFFAPTSGIKVGKLDIFGWGYTRTIHGIPMDTFCKELFNPVICLLMECIFSEEVSILNWDAFEEEIYESFKSLLDFMIHEQEDFKACCKDLTGKEVEYLRKHENKIFLDALISSFVDIDKR